MSKTVRLSALCIAMAAAAWLAVAGAAELYQPAGPGGDTTEAHYVGQIIEAAPGVPFRVVAVSSAGHLVAVPVYVTCAGDVPGASAPRGTAPYPASENFFAPTKCAHERVPMHVTTANVRVGDLDSFLPPSGALQPGQQRRAGQEVKPPGPPAPPSKPGLMATFELVSAQFGPQYSWAAIANVTGYPDIGVGGMQHWYGTQQFGSASQTFGLSFEAANTSNGAFIQTGLAQGSVTGGPPKFFSQVRFPAGQQCPESSDNWCPMQIDQEIPPQTGVWLGAGVTPERVFFPPSDKWWLWAYTPATGWKQLAFYQTPNFVTGTTLRVRSIQVNAEQVDTTLQGLRENFSWMQIWGPQAAGGDNTNWFFIDNFVRVLASQGGAPGTICPPLGIFPAGVPTFYHGTGLSCDQDVMW